jgi:hypothetical protein
MATTSNHPKKRSGMRNKTPKAHSTAAGDKKHKMDKNVGIVTEKDSELAVKPVNPFIDFFLGACYISLCLYLIYNLCHREQYMLIFFICSLILVGFGINFVRLCSKNIVIMISTKFRSSTNVPKDCRNPMKSKLLVRKFTDQAWQLTIHTLMSITEIYLIFFMNDGENSKWWSNPETCFKPCPVDYIEGRDHHPAAMQYFYLFQLAIWVYTAFSCKWIESRRKDYLEMMVHHVATICLVSASFLYHEHNIGLVILFIHDFSDVILDLMKLLNYLKLENSHGFYMVETAFALNVVIVWPYMRLYYFPVHVFWGGSFNGYAKHCGKVEENNFYLRIEACKKLGSCYTGGMLLCLLVCLHFFWYWLMLRILYKLVTGKSKPNHAGKEVYEGED